MDAVSDRIRLNEATLSEDFRWIDELGNEDGGYFLAKLNAEFTGTPSGFSFGDGRVVFADHLSSELLERIATVAGLIEFIQSRVALRTGRGP